MGRQIAMLKITGELIEQALAMPEGTRILGIRFIASLAPQEIGGIAEFIVSHPDLPETPEGVIVSELIPILTVTEEEDKPFRRTEWDWNLPD